MDYFITVIIPFYNRRWCLEKAIESVLNQTYKKIELILVDDGSTDDPDDILNNYKDHSQVKIFRTQNQGVSLARNYAIERASDKTNWFTFLDSDDEWLPEKLEKQIKFANENPEIRIIHGEEIWVRNGKRVNPMKKHQKSGGNIFERCLELCLISPSTVMIHKDVFSEVGLFDPAMTVCEDYDLWLRTTHKYEVGYIEDFLITKYGGHEDQLSHKYKAMDYYRAKAIDRVLKEDLTESQREQALKVLKKKCEILIAGYKKHQNLKNIEEIQDILNNAS